MADPTRKAYRLVSRSKTALLPVFSEECPPDLQLLEVAFTHQISVQRGRARRPAGDTFEESLPRRACHLPRYPLGEMRKPKFGFQETWGLGGGAEARWGRKRSGVLQPVGQVELEFRRVGGREAASGKRKKTQAARGVRPGPGRVERWLRGPGRAARPRDLEGLPLFAGPDISARGRRCPISPGSRLPL